MKNEKVKVIFDTNVWINFLIGKQLALIQKYISSQEIIIVTTNQLIQEIELVTCRDK